MKTGNLDLVIRGGTIHDGTGAPGFVGDVGVLDGRIVEIGVVATRGAEEIDARGQLVTPGFVDIHTHYDGQAVWADQLSPSSWHGVTTVVQGNCGVGFAPCKPDDRDSLIMLMEGVEDIPNPVLHEGLTWSWESFSEYLDVLAQTPRDIDLCALIPHAPVRVFVMGERALHLEPATLDDVSQMRALVADAMRAGAFGLSTSRTTVHRTLGGEFMPTLLAREQEIFGLLKGMRDAGGGMLEFVTDPSEPDGMGEYHMVRRGLEATGCSAVFSMVQTSMTPDAWRELSDFADDAIENGISLRPVAAPRAIGLIMGLEASQNPFSGTRTYHGFSGLPLAERVARMKDPEVRQRILTEDPLECYSFMKNMKAIGGSFPYSNMYRFGRPPNYTPSRDDSIAAIAARQNRPEAEVAYDILLEDDGMGFIYVPVINFASGDVSVCGEMLDNPNTIMGLSDGGAHVGFILDAGFPTWFLTHWVRQEKRYSIPEGIRRLTSDTADQMGLSDRGRIAVGLRADMNVIDFDRLEPDQPYVAYDLPSGGKRMLQGAQGYTATIVAGRVTYRNGEDTGERPGTLVRSPCYVASPADEASANAAHAVPV
jgi:N-acyl-D-aspartate/D-glutamate deacylase